MVNCWFSFVVFVVFGALLMSLLLALGACMFVCVYFIVFVFMLVGMLHRLLIVGCWWLVDIANLILFTCWLSCLLMFYLLFICVFYLFVNWNVFYDLGCWFVMCVTVVDCWLHLCLDFRILPVSFDYSDCLCVCLFIVWGCWLTVCCWFVLLCLFACVWWLWVWAAWFVGYLCSVFVCFFGFCCWFLSCVFCVANLFVCLVSVVLRVTLMIFFDNRFCWCIAYWLLILWES